METLSTMGGVVPDAKTMQLVFLLMLHETVKLQSGKDSLIYPDLSYEELFETEHFKYASQKAKELGLDASENLILVACILYSRTSMCLTCALLQHFADVYGAVGRKLYMTDWELLFPTMLIPTKKQLKTYIEAHASNPNHPCNKP